MAVIRATSEHLTLELESSRGLARLDFGPGLRCELHLALPLSGAPLLQARGTVKGVAGPVERLEIQTPGTGGPAARLVLGLEKAHTGLAVELVFENRGPRSVHLPGAPSLRVTGLNEVVRRDDGGAWCLARAGSAFALLGKTHGEGGSVCESGEGLEGVGGHEGRELSPGRARSAGCFWLGVDPDPWALLEAWAERCAFIGGARLLPRGGVDWPGPRHSEALPDITPESADRGDGPAPGAVGRQQVRTTRDPAAFAHEAGRLWHLAPAAVGTTREDPVRLETALSLASFGGYLPLADHPDSWEAPALHRLQRALPPLARRLRRLAPNAVASSMLGGRWAVLLWNPHDEERELGVEAAVLAELGSGPWSGYDFWPNRALGRLDGVVPARAVAPGGCRVVGLTPPSAGPVVIGSSLHLGMGTREVAQLRAEAGLLILRLRHRGRHEGDVWIQLPKRDAPLRIPVSFRDQVERRIRIP